MSKLKEFLDKEKIDPRRVLAASKKTEAPRHEDRQIKLAKKKVKSGKPTDAHKELATQKGRSGKKVTKPLLAKAIRGDKVSAGAKGRIVRAVNEVLTTKKKGEVSSKDLF